MASSISVSAVVSGFSARIRQPKPLPGENLLGLLIRNKPQVWRNTVEHIVSALNPDDDARRRLLSGQFLESELSDPRIEQEVERFANYHAPNHWRTMNSLVKLRHEVSDNAAQEHYGFTLVDILIPRQRAISTDSVAIQAEQMGATVMWFDSTKSRLLNLSDLLSHVHGQFLWSVPGGTYFYPSIVVHDLQRVLRYLAASPRRAFYTDNAESVIYRVSALRELSAEGADLSANSREIAGMLQAAGYEFSVDNDPDRVLCELEKEYGGIDRHSGETPSDSRKSWWRSILG